MSDNHFPRMEAIHSQARAVLSRVLTPSQAGEEEKLMKYAEMLYNNERSYAWRVEFSKPSELRTSAQPALAGHQSRPSLLARPNPAR
jgi:hypothetical protein